MEQKLSLGNFDKSSFLEKLKENLLKIPNLPLHKETYMREGKGIEISSHLKKRGKALEQEAEEEFQQVVVQQGRTQAKFSTAGIKFGKKKRNYLNLFSVDRAVCRLCHRKEKTCEQYRACFNIESFRGVDIFQCLNCKCPMNSHNQVLPSRSFSNLLCKHINRRYVSPAHFDFKALTAIFFVDRIKSESFEIDVETFVSGLNEGSFNIFSFYEMEVVDLQKVWIEKYLYSMKLQIPKEQYEDYIQFMDRFIDMFDMCGNEEVYSMRKRLSDPTDIEKLEFFIKLLDKVNRKLVRPFERNQIAFVFLITAQRQDPYADFKKFLKGTQGQMPAELEFFYSSRTRYHGVRDGLLFFPQFFKLSVSSFIITQRVDDQQTDRRKINDTFKDMLDFNNFSVIKEDFKGFTFEQLKTALRFIPDAEKFLNYCMNEGVLPLKIVSKVGPQSLTILSQSVPNFYRIASANHNQELCDRLCPDLFNSQRVLVVYRPLIVRSGIEELLGGVWRVNDFVLVKRIYKRLSLDEASLLGQVEGIHPENFNSYVAMMLDGFSMIVLYSRPGAFSASKMMTVGCETGLRVRKSKIFTDVFVEHPMKNGLVFKEKLQMNFHNIFESYTEQNIFRSIRDLFDLEELVLQENVDSLSKNVFMDDDDEQVFLAQPPEVKKTQIVGDLRQQVVKDLTYENYNFFVYATSDEMTTEQLTSLFMSDCTQVQQLFIVVKPLVNTAISKENYLQSIRTLLKRMNYIIIDAKECQLKEEMCSDLIQLLSPVRYPQAIVESYIEQYSTNKLYVMSVAKPAGRYEMKNFLRGFSFELDKQLELPDLVHELRPVLIPCLNVEVYRFVSKLFNEFLDTFDGTMFIKDAPTNTQMPQVPQPDLESRLYLLNYMLMSTFGLEADTLAGYDVMSWEFYDEIKVLNHCHMRVQSKHHGNFEVRVRNFTQLSRYNLNYLAVVGEYQLLSWYYAKVNLNFKQRCPIAYQYRILHEERAKQGEFDQVFDCQEYCGRIFLLEIYHQIFQFGNDVFQKIKQKIVDEQAQIQKNWQQSQATGQVQIQRRQLQQLDNNLSKVAELMEARSKIIAYFWGVKLSKFTKELELIDSTDFPNGYGPIVSNEDGFECQYKVQSDEYDGLHEVERKRFSHILNNLHYYLRERTEMDPSYEETINRLSGEQIQSELRSSMLNQTSFMRSRQEQQQSIVEKYFWKYFEIIFGKEGKNDPSPLLRYSFEEANLRLIPNLIDLTHLRIIQDKEYIQQTFDGAGGGMQFDHNYEFEEMQRTQILNAQRDLGLKKKEAPRPTKQPLNNFVLVYANPSVRSRFRLWANILFILHVELRLQKQYDNFLKLEVFLEDGMFKTSVPSNPEPVNLTQSMVVQQAQFNKSMFAGGMTYFQWFKNRFVMDKEKVIQSFINGFEESYFLEEEVVQKLQAMHKEAASKKKPQIPSLSHMHLFLICLEELDVYIQSYNQIQIQQVHIGKQIVSKQQLHDRWKDRTDQGDEFKTEVNQLDNEMELLRKRKVKVESFIFSIFQFVLSDDFRSKFYFDSEEMQLNFNQTKSKEEKFNIEHYIDYIQNHLVHLDSLKAEEDMQQELTNYFVGKQERNFGKEFIPSKRYFLPLELGNNKREWGKLDQEQIDERIKQVNEVQTEKNLQHLETFKNAPFMKNIEKDDIQSKWLEGLRGNQQGRFVDTRPDKKKTGIYVDTLKTVDKKIDEKIDGVIKKFMVDKMNNFSKK